MLYTVPARFIKCCDLRDPEYPKLCSMHLNSGNLLDALVESSKPLDDRVTLELHKSCGHKGALLLDAK